MGLIFILLSTACSLTIAQVLKQAREKNISLMQVLVFNYLTAVIISLFLNPDITAFKHVELPLIVLAGTMGFIFIANLFVYSASLHRSGMGISIAAMRVSLVIPVGVSILVFGERIDGTQWIGVILVFLALALMLPRIRINKIDGMKDAMFPLLLFVMTGIADTSMKVYERVYSTAIPEYAFLSLIFAFSLLFGMLVLQRGDGFRFTLSSMIYGVIVGVANLYSSFFLLKALSFLSGSLVFSLVNILNVIFGALIGYLVWKDLLTNKQKAGLAVAALSIVLLIG